MKNIFLAAAIALGTLSFAAPDVQAATTTVTIKPNGTVRVREREHRRRHVEVCRVKTVKTYRHHRVVIRKVRICR